MSIDIDKLNLTSEQLYELARKKEEQEQETARRAERLAELNAKREEILDTHRTALAEIDQALKELTSRREQLIDRHQKTLIALDSEIAALKPEPTAAADDAPLVLDDAPAAAPSPALPSADKGDTDSSALETAIREIMHRRQSISFTLLKEQLQARKIRTPDLGKQLDQFVRAGILVRKGGDNYALGRKI